MAVRRLQDCLLTLDRMLAGEQVPKRIAQSNLVLREFKVHEASPEAIASEKVLPEKAAPNRPVPVSTLIQFQNLTCQVPCASDAFRETLALHFRTAKLEFHKVECSLMTR